MALSERERMGSGGLRGLQIPRSGASSARGGFDSHAFPPRFGRAQPPARAGEVAPRALLAILLAATLAAPSRAQARSDSTAVARPVPVSRDTMVIPLGTTRPAEPSAASDSTRRRVFTAADSARYAAERARRAPPAAPKGFDQPKWVMMRSLVVPGWGQAYNHAWWKAAGVALTEGYLIARIVEDSRALNRLQRDVDLTSDPAREQMLSDEYIARSDRYVGRQWILGAVVAYALTDAYIDAHFRNFRIEFEHDPALPAGDADAAGLRVSWQEKF
jgi:uncharacterized protein DUF5683